MSRSKGARLRNSVPSSNIIKGGWIKDPANPGKYIRGPKYRAIGRYIFFSQTYREMKIPDELLPGVIKTELVPDPPQTARRIDGPNGREYVTEKMYREAVARATEKLNAG